MGGPGAGAGEKAKDFNSAIKRLFSELHGFKAVILVALILAIAGSILSISAPNILSDLTDEISTGLVVNKDNMQELSSKITENFSQEKMADVMPKILQMNLSKDSITQIMSSQDISTEDKQKFQDVIKQSSESEKQDELFKSIAQLPESILNIILPDSTYEGKEISNWEYWVSSDPTGIAYKGIDGYKGYLKGELIPVTKGWFYGWKTAIEIGAYNDEGKLVKIGTVSSGLTDELREDFKNNPSKYLNKVVELQCMEKDAKEHTLRHPFFKRFRDDKNEKDCTFKEIF